MADTVTNVSMWKDQFGQPFDTEAEAVASNQLADLLAFLNGITESVGGMDGCDRVALAKALLSGFTMTPAA